MPRVRWDVSDEARQTESKPSRSGSKKGRKTVHGRKKTPFVGSLLEASTHEISPSTVEKSRRKSHAFAFLKAIGSMVRRKSTSKPNDDSSKDNSKFEALQSPPREVFPPSPSSSEASEAFESSPSIQSGSTRPQDDKAKPNCSIIVKTNGSHLSKQSILSRLEQVKNTKATNFLLQDDSRLGSAWFLNLESTTVLQTSKDKKHFNEMKSDNGIECGASKIIDEGDHMLIIIPGKPSVAIPKLDLSWAISHIAPVVKRKKGILASFVSKLSPEPAWSPKPKVALHQASQPKHQKPSLVQGHVSQQQKINRKRSWH